MEKIIYIVHNTATNEVTLYQEEAMARQAWLNDVAKIKKNQLFNDAKTSESVEVFDEQEFNCCFFKATGSWRLDPNTIYRTGYYPKKIK